MLCLPIAELAYWALLAQPGGLPAPVAHAIHAATGAGALTYLLCFVVRFSWMLLCPFVLAGGALGLVGWRAAWDLAWRRRLLPAGLEPYLATWTRDGLVAGERLLSAVRRRQQALQRCKRVIVAELARHRSLPLTCCRWAGGAAPAARRRQGRPCLGGHR